MGRGRGRSSPGSSYGSSSNTSIMQMGRKSLINSRISQSEASSSVHLEDIPEDSSLYAQLQAYLSQKKNDTFASIAKEDNDDIKSYEKGIIADSSVRHIARKISIQDGDKEEMINNYLEEVKRSLLLNLTQIEKSDTSMRSETSDDTTDDNQEAQPIEKLCQKIL
uniref:Uncharacterized protein n=1 Tax=Solanum tuberosum TaxID=4113 RepID=M1CUN3_SOLTU